MSAAPVVLPTTLFSELSRALGEVSNEHSASHASILGEVFYELSIACSRLSGVIVRYSERMDL